MDLFSYKINISVAANIYFGTRIVHVVCVIDERRTVLPQACFYGDMSKMSVIPAWCSKRILFDSCCRSAVCLLVFLSVQMNLGNYLKTDYDREIYV
jgi:hypothetical protein